MKEAKAIRILKEAIEKVRNAGYRPRIRVGMPSPESMDLHIEDIYVQSFESSTFVRHVDFFGDETSPLEFGDDTAK